jgi:hypothetical protein
LTAHLAKRIGPDLATAEPAGFDIAGGRGERHVCIKGRTDGAF